MTVLDQNGTEYEVSLKEGKVTVSHGGRTASAPAEGNPTQTARALAARVAPSSPRAVTLTGAERDSVLLATAVSDGALAATGGTITAQMANDEALGVSRFPGKRATLVAKVLE